MARRGVRSTGVDWCPEMVDFAAQSATREGLAIEWQVGDMRAFELPRAIDLVACLFDSIDGLLSIDDFVAHFRAVAANLAPDGLYVIGQTHQRDANIIDYGPFYYQAERDNCRVALDWATDVRADPLTQTVDVGLTLRIDDNGRREVIQYRTIESFATPPFLIATAQLSGSLKALGWYGEYSLDQLYDNSPSAKYCVSIFQKI